MSTLRCTNLQDTSGGNSLTTAQIYNGAAKAWVNFNGTGTVAIRASFNVSSITDVGTGLYTVNFTTAMADANYAALLTIENPSGNTSPVPFLDSSRAQTTGGVTVCMHQSGVGDLDRARIAVAIFR
jgi:hypothetical protein